MAAITLAPEEYPTYSPCSELNLLVISCTSESETVMISSAKSLSQCGGIRLYPV